MGHQVVKQPDGHLAVWSTETDDWVLLDADPVDVLDYFVGLAAADALRSTQQVLDAVLGGEPRRVYFQFTRTYEQLETERKRRHGGGEENRQ